MSAALLMLAFIGLPILLTVTGIWAGKALARFPSLGRQLLGAIRPRQSGFDALEPGPVVLRGRVAPIDPVISPETGERGVYLTYTADEWGASVAIGRLGGQWLRTEEAEEAAPFELTDGEHSVLVEPERAEFKISRDTWVKREQADGKLIRYNEGMVKEGDELLVMGTCRMEGGFDPSAGYRGHNYRVVVASADGAPLRISRPRGQVPSLALVLAWNLAKILPVVVVFWGVWRFAG